MGRQGTGALELRLIIYITGASQLAAEPCACPLQPAEISYHNLRIEGCLAVTRPQMAGRGQYKSGNTRAHSHAVQPRGINMGDHAGESNAPPESRGHVPAGGGGPPARPPSRSRRHLPSRERVTQVRYRATPRPVPPPPPPFGASAATPPSSKPSHWMASGLRGRPLWGMRPRARRK